MLDAPPVTLYKAPAGLVAIESSGHQDRVNAEAFTGQELRGPKERKVMLWKSLWSA